MFTFLFPNLLFPAFFLINFFFLLSLGSFYCFFSWLLELREALMRNWFFQSLAFGIKVLKHVWQWQKLLEFSPCWRKNAIPGAGELDSSTSLASNQLSVFRHNLPLWGPSHSSQAARQAPLCQAASSQDNTPRPPGGRYGFLWCAPGSHPNPHFHKSGAVEFHSHDGTNEQWWQCGWKARLSLSVPAETHGASEHRVRRMASCRCQAVEWSG